MEMEVDMDSDLREIFNFVCSGTLEQITSHFQPVNDDGKFQENDIHSQATDKPNEMLSLLLETFQSRDDLLGSVRRIALAQGYATVIRRSKREKLVVVGCDRGSTYRPKKILVEQRERQTASRLIDCPFEIRGRKKPDGFWKIEIKSLEHNHELSSSMSGHPSCRRFTNEEILCVKEMSMAGIPPRQILSSLRQHNPNLQAIARTVSNAKAKIRMQSLSGRTMIQALLEELGQGGFTYNIEYDQEGRLTHLFFAHPTSILLTKNYPNVFVMDCTYKTNSYKMPLLDIIGVSSFNSSFFSCFAFMQKEEEDDYVWALTMFSKLLTVETHPLVIVSDRELALMKAISIVFPRAANLLCVWHIEKNVLSNCKPHFNEEADWIDFMTTWTKIIQSPDESSFNEAWQDFEARYKENVSVIKYIKSTWLPLKEHFVSAWTEQSAHFKNRVTSRAEGAHAMLKRYLQVSTGNLREVKEKICLAIENQFQEVNAKLSSDKLRVPHKFQVPLFKELVTHVSTFALNELYKQYELARSGNLLSQCKGHFLKTMGMPCAHMIREMGILKLSDIHEQWIIYKRSLVMDKGRLGSSEDKISDLMIEFKDKYLQMPIVQKENTQRQLSQFLTDSSLPLILEPNVQPHKGRPLGSKNRKDTSSTRRDPSMHEIIEKSRRCSLCNGIRHNSRTCPLKAEASGSRPVSSFPR